MRKLMSAAAILLAVSVYGTSFAQTTPAPKADAKPAKTMKAEPKAAKMEAKTEAKAAKAEAKTAKADTKVAKADAKEAKAKHHKGHKAAEAK